MMCLESDLCNEKFFSFDKRFESCSEATGLTVMTCEK